MVAGSTGEGPLLTESERTAVIETAVETAQKRLPIIVGCGAASTPMAIQFAQEAEKLNADAIMVQAPYYIRPAQAGILQHFQEIAKSTSLPIIAYNHPGRVGVPLEEDTLIRACESIDSLIAIKDSSPDMARTLRLRLSLPERVSLLCGDDALNMAYLAHGGTGIISVTANLAPVLCKQFIQAWAQNDALAAFALHRQLMPLHQAMVCAPNPCPVKFALAAMGKIANEPRLPLLPIDASSLNAKKILNALMTVQE